MNDLPDVAATVEAVALMLADAAVHQLDDAFRQSLTERSAVRVNLESVWALVAGAALENLDGEIHALRSWYVTLGDSFVHVTVVPPPHVRDTQGRRRLLDCVRAAVAGGDGTEVRSALVLLWANQHLDNLWRLEAHLGRSAVEASSDAPPH